ncbi:MAG: hypothetical protein EOO11_03540 [Chitinophagaceae bacterium]|nr:MAG: hypothetical protein EOO11_03540 [Chitinophagaceae bacterium]
MTNNQEEKFNMYDATDDVLTDAAAIVDRIPDLAAGHDSLQHNMSDIEVASGLKDAATAGTGAEKQQQKKQLATALLHGCGLLKAHASATGDAALMEQVTFSHSRLERTRDGKLPVIADSILGLARTHLDALKRKGFTDEQYTGLAGAAAAFRECIPAPKNARHEKSLQVEKIAALFAATDKLLREQVDPMVRNLEGRHPDFVKRYFAARSIDDVVAATPGEATTGNA